MSTTNDTADNSADKTADSNTDSTADTTAATASTAAQPTYPTTPIYPTAPTDPPSQTNPIDAMFANADTPPTKPTVPAPGADRVADPRLRPRASTIVWGAILLIVAAVALVASRIDTSVFTPAFVIWTVVGVGALLVLGGIVGAIARATTRS